MNDSNITKSKKGLYIAIGAIIIIALIFIAKKINNNGISGSDIQKAADSSVNFEKDKSKVTVGGGKLPSNWPSDAPKYANAKIQYSGTSNPQTGESGSAIVFTTADKSQAVVDFYRKELVANGWTIQQTSMMGKNTVIVAKKDARTFGIYVADAQNGQVTVTAGISFGK